MLEGSVSFTQCALNENMSTFSVYKNTVCMNTMCPFGFSGNKYSVYGLCFLIFFFFFSFWPHYLTKSTVNSALVYCSQTHKFHFSTTFSLKMDPTILFTHLKIILLQCFSVFSFSFQFSAVSKRTLTKFVAWYSRPWPFYY